jgi:hypothetical protein
MEGSEMFYTYGQTNSGGEFIIDRENGIGVNIIIEADSDEEAESKFDKISDSRDDFFWSCSCCGPRWDEYDREVNEVPSIRGKPVSTLKMDDWDFPTFIHFKNGVIAGFENKADDIGGK